MDIFKIIWPDFPVIKGIKFTLAEQADAEKIGLLSQDLIEGGLWGWSWNPVRVAERIRDINALVLKAVAGDQMVGFAIMKFGGTVANLELLAVKSENQRTGIGRCLVEFLNQSAYLYRNTLIQVEVREKNAIARAFYRSLGFRDIEVIPRYYSGCESAVRMSRRVRVKPLADIAIE